MPIITLTTDFGHSDAFVGAMKGVILSIAPRAAIVDLCHEIPAHDIVAGAMLLEDAYACFPKGTVHAAVVDPGVGGARRALAIQTRRCFFVGPDNGIFDLVLRNETLVRAVTLDNPRFHRASVSATFHGRDIFAPAAAYLARGTRIERLGTPAANLAALNVPHPIVKARTLEAHVLRVDRFGNLITDLKRAAFEAWNAQSRPVAIRIGRTNIGGIRRTFADVRAGERVAYFGSTERLEIAINLGRASDILKARAGTHVELSFRAHSLRPKK